MSDCSRNAMSAPKPIRGEIHWKEGMRPAPLRYARYVNGQERVAEWVELDGTRLYPDDLKFQEVFEGGKRVAIEFDGERFVPAPSKLYAIRTWDDLDNIGESYIPPKLFTTREAAEAKADNWRGDRGGYEGYACVFEMEVVA